MTPFDFKNPTASPIRLTIPLPFPDEDVKRYPWLKGDRYYLLQKELDHGGFSRAFLGYPCDINKLQLPGSEPVVVKIPNLADNRTSVEVTARLSYIQAQTIIEWAHVRNRLFGCTHANPIFDMGTVWTQDPLFEMSVTVQPFLSQATPLKQWLVDQRLRPKPAYDPDGAEVDRWPGLSEWSEWLKIATLIAEGLADVHQSRVIHGDIWPPNIYIADSPLRVIFIDFGESFLITPTGDARFQGDHPYRAPERGNKIEHVPTEQVDVYSFGKTMLYLAIGRDERIPRESPPGQLLHGHLRRHYTRALLFNSNAPLVAAHPDIVDIIVQCTAMDPVDRPTMLEVCDQLHRATVTHPLSPLHNRAIVARLEKLAATTTKAAAGGPGIFLRFMNKKLDEVERLIESCYTEMVDIRGTRNELINVLVTLYDQLEKGDSWTTLTTSSVWQRNALGLDGRYATATIDAVRRGAAVRRTFIVSVEELGVEWVEAFTKELQDTGNDELIDLGKTFKTAINTFRYKSSADDYKARSNDFLKGHQERFKCVLESLKSVIHDWKLTSFICSDKTVSIRETPGLYVGIVPVATLADIRELRTLNPVSLLYMAKEPHERDRWLLVMTDIRGRNEDESSSMTWPHLFGVRVYRSVMGLPKDRVLGLERLLSERSTNIGRLTEDLARCAATVK